MSTKWAACTEAKRGETNYWNGCGVALRDPGRRTSEGGGTTSP